MSFEFKVEWCPVCSQGWVEIVMDKVSKELLFCCSECEVEWSDFESIKQKNSNSCNEDRQIETPSFESIKAKGWEKHLLQNGID
jgi:hypothetical protein